VISSATGTGKGVIATKIVYSTRVATSMKAIKGGSELNFPQVFGTGRSRGFILMGKFVLLRGYPKIRLQSSHPGSSSPHSSRGIQTKYTVASQDDFEGLLADK